MTDITINQDTLQTTDKFMEELESSTEILKEKESAINQRIEMMEKELPTLYDKKKRIELAVKALTVARLADLNIVTPIGNGKATTAVKSERINLKEPRELSDNPSHMFNTSNIQIVIDFIKKKNDYATAKEIYEHLRSKNAVREVPTDKNIDSVLGIAYGRVASAIPELTKRNKMFGIQLFDSPKWKRDKMREMGKDSSVFSAAHGFESNPIESKELEEA